MRIDIFLSTLLFGITLLTGALAIMHLVCDGVLRWSGLPPVQRRRIRSLLLGSTISVSLLIFLFRLVASLSGRDLLSLRNSGMEAGFFPRLISRAEGNPPPLAPIAREFRPEGTWTLYAKPTHELRVQKLQGSAIALLSNGVFVWSNAEPGPLCRSWVDRVRSLGIEPRPMRALGALPPGALLIVCPQHDGDRLSWQKVREHVFAGGSLLAVGRQAGDAAETVQTLAHLTGFKEIDPAKPVRMVIGGPRFAWGGFPSGILTQVAANNSELRRELALGEVAAGFGDALGLREDVEAATTSTVATARFSALVTAEYGSGRVAWSGLPANAFGKTQLLHGPAWELLGQRLVAHLLRAPQAGLEAWPSADPAPVVIAVHGATNLSQSVDLAKALQRRKIPTSHYLVLSQAVESPRQFKRLLAAGEELGVSEPDHASVLPLDFFERYDRLRRWLETYEDLPKGDTAPDSARQVSGALTHPGANAFADQYAALMANQLTYALMDPFGDQLSPARFHLTRTSNLARHLSESESLNDAPSERSLIVLPHRSPDDELLLRSLGLGAEKNELKRRILEQYRQARWAGGPFLLRLSTTGLGRSDRLSTLEAALDGLRAEGATFLSAEELIEYWETRSEAEVILEPVDRERIPRDLLKASRGDDDAEVSAADGGPLETADSADDESWDEPAPQLGSRKRPHAENLAFKIVVRNGSSRPLSKAVLRITEPADFRVLSRKAPEKAHKFPELANTRVHRVALPALAPGETTTLWLLPRAR